MTSLENALELIQIIISISIIGVILLQARGTGGLGSLFGGGGGATGATKTRRGLEKTLFQITVGLAIAFIIVPIIQMLIT